MDLMDADTSDQVRFQLPVTVGMRYGEPPIGIQRAAALVPHRIAITANIHMSGAIKSITSPTHSINTDSSEVVTTLGSLSYMSEHFLQQDFVLLIKAEGLDSPRCFVETHPSGTTALQLTMVPKFNFPPIPVQEYIFLVDRSGSMDGARIETAKNTLIMLLRSLPARGTTFNIFTFGTDCESQYGESVQYSEQTLTEAVRAFVFISCIYPLISLMM
jgi:hypothetical protein